MKRNYSELICDKQKRQLTAKGNKFVWDCIRIVANQNNCNKYSSQISEVKERLKNLLHFLIIDKELSLLEIKELIKNRNLKIE